MKKPTTPNPLAKSVDEEQERDGHPWRDNIEAITMAIIMAVLLKYFVVEAYKIPTGSMQPTLMGLALDDGDGVFDRILVDKLSYHFRDPERFEVAVFKYPLDRSKNFIKRIWGMPNEELRIRGGDVFRRDLDQEDGEWELVRRPKPIQRETLKLLDTTGEWRFEGDSEAWRVEGETLSAKGPGSASYPRTKTSVRDHYTDGYPLELAKRVRRRGQAGGSHNVADLRLEGEVQPEAGCTGMTVSFSEGTRTYDVRFPGPAAAEDARPSIRIQDSEGLVRARTVEAERPWRMRAGASVRFGAQNLDDLLELEIDGEILIEEEIAAALDQPARVTIHLEGGGARIDGLQVYRDIYYTVERQVMTRWKIPEDSYVMLGDNTQNSADGREWQLEGMKLTSGPEAGRILRGGLRGNDNPRRVSGRPGGTEIYFRDLYGERHELLQSEVEVLTPEKSPFVPRKLITGRALLVFWPFKPSLGTYRLKWIH